MKILKLELFFMLFVFKLNVISASENAKGRSDDYVNDNTEDENSNAMLTSDLPDVEFSWLSSLLEDFALQRSNKVMKLPTIIQTAPLKVTNNLNPQPYNGFRPVDIPERIVGGNSGYNNVQTKPSNGGEVSETDMYLLGAIEKLAYKVDTMEKRLRRTEELLHHVIEATGQTQRQDPCPGNFTRVERGCYHFSTRQYNWKSASSMCKSLGANLLELETPDEYSELITYVSSVPSLRENEYWTGGLNPGLLWIWSNSAKPVLPKNPNPSKAEDVVHGVGRCLKLSFNAIGKLYQYHGADCSHRYKYICEHEENITVRALKNYQKSLKESKAVPY